MTRKYCNSIYLIGRIDLIHDYLYNFFFNSSTLRQAVTVIVSDTEKIAPFSTDFAKKTRIQARLLFHCNFYGNIVLETANNCC